MQLADTGFPLLAKEGVRGEVRSWALQAGGHAGWVSQEEPAAKALGDWPVQRLKAREKVLVSAKPSRKAISVTLSLPSAT